MALYFRLRYTPIALMIGWICIVNLSANAKILTSDLNENKIVKVNNSFKFHKSLPNSINNYKEILNDKKTYEVAKNVIRKLVEIIISGSKIQQSNEILKLFTKQPIKTKSLQDNDECVFCEILLELVEQYINLEGKPVCLIHSPFSN